MKSDGLLVGRVGIVTGAGRGLGRAHAIALAREGASVVVNDVGCDLQGLGSDDSVADEVVEEICSFDGSAVSDATDVSSFEGGDRVVRAAIEAFGKIDIVVNNAGISAGDAIEDLTEAALGSVLRVHLMGYLGTTRAAFPHMKKQRYGRIVNTVSEAALDDRHPGGVAYGAAKAAVWAATFAAAREGHPHGITVNAISPGARTRMSAGYLDSLPSAQAIDLDPGHVARVVAFLVSERAGDITGRVVHAAGGAIREYLVRRYPDTELVTRLEAELAPPEP